MKQRKVVTNHVYPPIPLRQFDWCAYFDGEEEKGGYGWGATEAEAIADFKELVSESCDHDWQIDKYQRNKVCAICGDTADITYGPPRDY